MNDLFEKINELKQIVDAHRPFPLGLEQNMREVTRIEWIYHSNAIDGNTLSLLQTKLVVEEGLTIADKKIKEHIEAINHAEVIDYVEKVIANTESFNEYILKHVHSLLYQNLDKIKGGTYRCYNLESICEETPAQLKIKQEVRELFVWFEQNKRLLHPVELATVFHFKLLSISPFFVGNGKTARVVMNLILMKANYPPAIIKAGESYYVLFERAKQKGDITPFIGLVTACVEESLQRILYGLGS
ncbi:Fic family protein (plasmid) [Aneurinibacillus sp. Ricciae_BoGa-3]|uniref:Fic family protein n=1 Tax=Aneurinibacillus sp. Ricciae_BoGa-3 TaxID=3022697 RepID=UPI0023408DB6|nr:Fic family protein [Aneurinibacillus sp. Ricciae_BoGa-3]WCK57406.1 Fic family protein [Aneurinibacillus sp. Ricciae_BoGa-3]